MGFSGCKIPGHSGTDFKHKKAFSKSKELYKYSAHHSNAPSQSFRQTLADRAEQRNTNYWATMLFVVPILLFTFGFLYHFNVVGFYSTEIDNSDQMTTRVEQVVHKKHLSYTEEFEQTYKNYINSGRWSLKYKNLKDAQLFFSKAKKMYPYRKDVNMGLTKTLLLRCEEENLYCDLAQDYFDYTIQLEDITYKDLKSLNKLKDG